MFWKHRPTLSNVQHAGIMSGIVNAADKHAKIKAVTRCEPFINKRKHETFLRYGDQQSLSPLSLWLRTRQADLTLRTLSGSLLLVKADMPARSTNNVHTCFTAQQIAMHCRHTDIDKVLPVWRIWKADTVPKIVTSTVTGSDTKQPKDGAHLPMCSTLSSPLMAYTINRQSASGYTYPMKMLIRNSQKSIVPCRGSGQYIMWPTILWFVHEQTV